MIGTLYDVFGGTLRSELPIDDLPVSSRSDADWTLRVVDAPSDQIPGAPLGMDKVFGETMVRGFRNADSLSLVFDDTGRFDVSFDGKSITWHRPPSADLESARADITSRVLALALHAGGVYSLHASAVSINGAGVVFMAPKHHGKSTLCGALVVAGARALSDDTVPVQAGTPPTLAPGLPKLRLWSDAAARVFGHDQPDAHRLTKRVMDSLEDSQVEPGPVEFRSAYVLNPVDALPDGAAAARERLDSVAATMSLVMHAKLGPVLASGDESMALLNYATAIAANVPVYVLHVPRDLSRIGDVAQLVLSWHPGDNGHGQ